MRNHLKLLLILMLLMVAVAFPPESATAVSADEAYEIGMEAYIYVYPLVTMYDGDGFPAPNPIKRYAIGDRDPIKFNADDSLYIYIQPQSPGKDRESNWLPFPKNGELNITMRLYAPRIEALDGRWNPPAIQRVK